MAITNITKIPTRDEKNEGYVLDYKEIPNNTKGVLSYEVNTHKTDGSDPRKTEIYIPVIQAAIGGMYDVNNAYHMQSANKVANEARTVLEDLLNGNDVVFDGPRYDFLHGTNVSVPTWTDTNGNIDRKNQARQAVFTSLGKQRLAREVGTVEQGVDSKGRQFRNRSLKAIPEFVMGDKILVAHSYTLVEPKKGSVQEGFSQPAHLHFELKWVTKDQLNDLKKSPLESQ